jgi:hypothetical protein
MQLLLTALPTAWCKQYVEVMFAVLTTLKLVENSFWESSETLRTTAKMTVALHHIYLMVFKRLNDRHDVSYTIHGNLCTQHKVCEAL